MAANQPQQQDDDDDDIAAEPTKIFLPHSSQSHLQNGFSHSPPRNGTVDQPVDQRHYLPSIPSTILIRQLPSQGLSFQLWPAATSLVALLDHHRRVSATCPLSPIISAFSRGPDRPLKILELGSGTGLVGIAAALTLGATVTVTDLPHVVPNLQFNADANAGELALHGGTLRVEPLRWGEEADVEGIGRDFDLVLASDVVYHDHLYDPLIKTLHLLLCGADKEKEKKEEQEMVFVMAHLKRWKKEAAFFNRARKLFDVDVIHVDKPCEGSRVGVKVYRFTRKGQRLAQKKC
ncbi:hypothetical protein Tsubulata_014131 [Turnera subulata]|uniref:Uncharacterized protein n=1 Tax=Turnera subulata TaxID=218843 RepID=A0A9Q0JSJ4_9ROSI|nr:hypothetical protein Tsubulata_014131 [Turnera subulata]